MGKGGRAKEGDGVVAAFTDCEIYGRTGRENRWRTVRR